MQNVQSFPVYPHETLAFDATDPSGICRMFVHSIWVSCQYVGCLSIWRRVYVRNVSCSNCLYIRPEEELTLETLASETLCGGQFTFLSQLMKPNCLKLSWLMIRQRNRSKSLRFESSSWGIKIFPSRMFVTNTCHPSLKICSLNDRFTGLLMQQVFFSPRIFRHSFTVIVTKCK